MTTQPVKDGRHRVIVEGVTPQVDCGQFPAKRVIGDRVTVRADVFTDGHDALRVVLLHRKAGTVAWVESPMTALSNDRWEGAFTVPELGVYEYAVEGWVDHYDTWRRDLAKRVAAGQDVTVDLLAGAALIEAAGERARQAGATAEADRLGRWAMALRDDTAGATTRAAIVHDEELVALAMDYPDRRFATRSDRVFRVVVDPVVAACAAWYELFPRSTSPEPGRHGTLRDVIAQLPRVAGMGFDVLYLPPVHPIGRVHRKGPNNATAAGESDPGSPWAIGSEEGGHTAIHPELGTIEDFRALVAATREHGLALALDIAFQCAPDHPYVKQHPEWFRKRPDGTIQYAENPPKKYEDIFPFDFETEAWPSLWNELLRVVRFWTGEGVRIFRVDNPHTKAFPFWEWLIAEIKSETPDAVFLAEAFTRPKVMYRLAKIGFSQSYNYFPWRHTKEELTRYFEELYHTPVADFFRPNLWPNTPDILTEHLQTGGRGAFMGRAVLAATLGASYGIYGPAFELMEHEPREPGSEEYRDSEKYQVRAWDLDRHGSLAPFIARLNRIRRENPALQRNDTLLFHATDNEFLLCYSKTDPVTGNAILVVVNLDPHHVHAGFIDLPPEEFGLDPHRSFQAHDLLGDGRFLWQGARHYVQLEPWTSPAHVFRIRRHVRTERDFEYFL